MQRARPGGLPSGAGAFPYNVGMLPGAPLSRTLGPELGMQTHPLSFLRPSWSRPGSPEGAAFLRLVLPVGGSVTQAQKHVSAAMQSDGMRAEVQRDAPLHL